MVPLFAGAGWQTASSLTHARTELLAGVVVGSGVGYVLGGVFGRRTVAAVSKVEREFRRISAGDILAGSIGLVLGMVMAVLVSVPLFHLPPAAAYPTVAFLYLTLGFLGYRVGRTKATDLFALFGMKPRAAGTPAGEVCVVDTSALLDGRTLTLVRMGYLSGTLLVTRGVVDELQTIADSSDPARRARGRRGLDSLIALKRHPGVDVHLVEEEVIPSEPVDGRLVRLARARGGVLLTNDDALVKVATAVDVPVRSIAALADAMRSDVVPGDVVTVSILRPGRDAGQGVGYLEDGTMVVAEGAAGLTGTDVALRVTNLLQTSSGRLVFAKIEPGDEPV